MPIQFPMIAIVSVMPQWEFSGRIEEYFSMDGTE
jgi:hypothetical protein